MITATTLHDYIATYEDGTQYKILARGLKDALLSATYLNSKKLINVLRTGEW